ncbi:MAG: tRNA pseudouridine(55) synthase TruB [Bryobacteraceae bacterium]|jgi:tRNA pseudouridine55 synthase
MNGLVLIDKPAGCTSHDVVNRWRKLANTKRVGHLGTLDPMATGLLVLMTGRATRLAQYLGASDKTYVAEIVFGIISDTYDIEGVSVRTGVPAPSDVTLVRRALDPFRGTFLQTPPAVSAKKVHGVAAYKLVRKQIPVDLRAVEVAVKRLEVESIEPGKIELVVTCSSGTYIRSLAHDLGQQLGCGAVLSKLRRIQSGEFTIKQARTLDEFGQLAEADQLCDAVIPPARLLPQFPAEYFDSRIEAQIRQGRDFRTSPFVVPPGAQFVKALSHSGELIAIGELIIPNFYHPATVL